MKELQHRPPVAVIGGDMRSVYLSRLLDASGFDVAVSLLDGSGLPELSLAAALNRRCVILPLPVTRDGVCLNAPLHEKTVSLVDITHSLHPHSVVLCGGAGAQLRSTIEATGARVADYYDRDDVLERNAAITAEGAAALIMNQTKRTIFGSRCLVAGAGRCGRAMALLLLAMGADVTLTARKTRDFAWTRLNGLDYAETSGIAGIIGGFDTIVNTVPARIFTAEVLSGMRDDALLVELASGASGVDMDAARAMPKLAVYAPGLPGKCAPASAAEVLCDAITLMITEEFS